MRQRTWTDKQLKLAVEESVNLSEVLRYLNLSKYGGNRKHVMNHIKRLNLSLNHFTWQPRKSSRTGIFSAAPLEEILVENSSFSRTHLKDRLIKEKILKEECCNTLCPIKAPLWLGEKLVFHLDHINGVSDDNRLENLRLLCPNCHSQTDTYSNKQSTLKKKSALKRNNCLDCNVKIGSRAKRCRECNNLIQKHPTKIEWPPLIIYPKN